MERVARPFPADSEAALKFQMAPSEIIPPSLHNIEAEAALLGAMMIDNRIIGDLAEIIEADDFHEPLHARIFEQARQLVDAGGSATPVTLRPYFVDDPAIKEIGGVGYLATLTAQTAGLMASRDFARQLVDLAKRRRLIAECEAVKAAAADLSENAETLADSIDSALSAAIERKSSTSTYTLAQAVDASLQQIEDTANGKGPRGVLICDLPDFNAVAGTLAPGQLTILGGRPGMGKTAVALAVAKGAAANGHGTLLVSLEMRASELVLRTVSDMCFELGNSFTFENLLAGKLNEFDRRRIADMKRRIAEWPLHITDPSSLRVSRLGMLVRRYQRKVAAKGAKLELVVIDYLGLLSGDPKKSKYEEISEISRTLKQVAMECNVHVICLAQVNRECEKRDDKRPFAADLRDSGTIEQDADNIVFVFREQFYLEKSEPDPADAKLRPAWETSMDRASNRVEIYSDKRRQGRTARRNCWFFLEHQAVRGSKFYSERFQ